MPYRRRLRELECEPDPVDRLLGEAVENVARRMSEQLDQLDLFEVGPRRSVRADDQLHRVYTPDGRCFVGRWGALLAAMRDALAPKLSLREFMCWQAERWERATGEWIPRESARAFFEAATRAGLLELDP